MGPRAATAVAALLTLVAVTGFVLWRIVSDPAETWNAPLAAAGVAATVLVPLVAWLFAHPPPRERALGAVLDGGRRRVGLAFAVGRRHVVTSSRVVNAALGRGNTTDRVRPPDDDLITVSFAEDSVRQVGRVHRWGPSDTAPLAQDDLVVLRLDRPLPWRIAVLRLGRRGYRGPAELLLPQGGAASGWSTGEIADHRFRSRDAAPDPIDRESAGAPLLHPGTGRVVGMVQSTGDGRTGDGGVNVIDTGDIGSLVPGGPRPDRRALLVGAVVGVGVMGIGAYRAASQAAPPTPLRRVNGVGWRDLFDDPAFISVFEENGLDVHVQKLSTIEMTKIPDLAERDFALPASDSAKNAVIDRYKVRQTPSSDIVFTSNMVILTTAEVRDMLADDRTGLLSDRDGYSMFDTHGYARMMARRWTWGDVAGSQGYADGNRLVTIQSTDPHTSASGFTYLAMMADAVQSLQRPDTDREDPRPVVEALRPQFRAERPRQSDDLLTMFFDQRGLSSPLVFTYEHAALKFLLDQKKVDPGNRHRYALLYPEPAVVSTHHIVTPPAGDGAVVSRLIREDDRLLRRQAQLGIRNRMVADFRRTIETNGLAGVLRKGSRDAAPEPRVPLIREFPTTFLVGLATALAGP